MEPLVDMWGVLTEYLVLLEDHQQQKEDKRTKKGKAKSDEAAEPTKDPIATRIKCLSPLPPVYVHEGLIGGKLFGLRYVLNICRLIGQALYLVVKGSKDNALAMSPHFPRLVKVPQRFIFSSFFLSLCVRPPNL